MIMRKRQPGLDAAMPRLAEQVTEHQRPEPCACAGSGLPALGEICPDERDRHAIMLLRFVFAAYAYDNVACIDGGMGLANRLFGPEAAPLLMGRLLATVHALRQERQGNFRFLPANCTRISEDERELAGALVAAREHDPHAFEQAQVQVSRRLDAPLIRRSLWMLAVTVECISASDEPAVPDGNPTETRHLH